jgi:plastocyanin
MLRRQIVALSVVTFAALGLAVAVTVADPATTQAGGGCHMDEGAGYTEGAATVVRMDVCSFEPTVIRVPVGTNVRFLNTAQNEHAVSGRRNTWGSLDIMAPGADFSHRFAKAGIYPFTCPLHPGMVGAVIVGQAGQAAAPLTDVGVGTAAAPAPAAADVAADGQTGSAGVVPAAVGGAVAGGVVGLMAGLLVARRRPASTPADAVRTSPALDG